MITPMPRDGIKLYDDGGRPFSPDSVRQFDRGGNPLYVDSDIKVVDKCLRLWAYGRKEFAPLHEKMSRVLEFVHDKQWSEEEQAYFEKQNRAALTINILRPYMMQVSGLQRSGRSDIHVAGVDKRNDQQLAKITFDLLNHVAYDSRLEYVDSNVFNDGLCGIGSWTVGNDDNPMFGGVNVSRADQFSVLYDPDSYDELLNDCRWQIRAVMMNIEGIESAWPWMRGRLKIEPMMVEEWWNSLTERFKPSWLFKRDLVDVHNERLAVLQLFERREQNELMVVSANGDVVMPFPLGSGRVQEFHRLFPQFYVIPRKTRSIYVTTVVPYQYQVIENAVKQNYEYYPHVPFLSVRIGVRMPDASSYNYSLLGLQRELNMRRSNQQEYLIRSIRGGWWVFESSGGNKLLTQIEKDGHKVGKSYVVSGPPGSQPTPIVPPNIMQGLDYLEMGAVRYFELVTGLSVQSYGGQTSASESGVHRQMRREESQTTLFPMLDTFNQMRALVAHAILEREVAMLTPWTMVRIIGEDDNPKYVQLAEETIKNLKSIREYDIKIDESPYTTSMRKQQQEIRFGLLELVSQVNPMVAQRMLPNIIEESGLPEAAELSQAAEEIIMAGVQPPEGVQPQADATYPAEAGLAQ